MCGISALFLRSPSRSEEAFRHSLDIIKHRGPDGRGIIWGHDGGKINFGEHCDGAFSWALGHVRLAILDTSENGLQPMGFNGGRLWISFNGEIYNYLELKQELLKVGFCFITGTDTEVILAAYCEWGIQCLDRFVGMFAFVLVDLAIRRVFCARDRFGVKPLYFFQSASGTHVFSEPKQLQAFSECSFRINRQLLVDMLVDGVVNHVPDESLFNGVIPLVPAHYLSWDIDDSFPDLSKVRPYWELLSMVKPYSKRAAMEELEAAFVDAVRIRLRSDVPVGSCLSGGIDSSSIVGIASCDFGASMHTFSACFDGYTFDEQFYIDIVTRYCGTNSHKVFPTGIGCVADIDKVVYHQDEPFMDSSIYSQWCIMQAARNAGVPVLLDGQGGDEALCGYRKFSFLYIISLLKQGRFCSAFHNALLMTLLGDQHLFRFAEGQRYMPVFLRPDGGKAGFLLRPEAQLLQRNVWRKGNAGHQSFKDYQKDDLRRWSLPALLRYEDRNSMAHGIESRVPFLDHRFIELCMSIPDELFFLDGKTKRLFTGAMGNRIPREVHNRRIKIGFNTPNEDWFRGGGLGKLFEQEIMQSTVLRELVDVSLIKKDFAAFWVGVRRVETDKLFFMGCLATWIRIFKVEW